MFDHIGQRIKVATQVVAWIGIAICIITGMVKFFSDDDVAQLQGFLIMTLGSLGVWVGSFVTYGFGQLIENTDRLVQLLEGKKVEKAVEENEEKNVAVEEMTGEQNGEAKTKEELSE